MNDKSVETESISESEHVDQSESESSCTSSEQSEIDEESKGDDNIESDAENEDEEKLEVQDLSKNNKDSGCWTFENQKVAQVKPLCILCLTKNNAYFYILVMDEAEKEI